MLAKSLGRKRLLALMGELGMVSAETGQAIGQEELEDLRSSTPIHVMSQNLQNDSQVDNSCGPWANWFKCTGPM